MPVVAASRNMGLTRTGEVGWGVLGVAILYGVIVEGSCGCLGKSIPSRGDGKCKMQNTFKDQQRDCGWCGVRRMKLEVSLERS